MPESKPYDRALGNGADDAAPIAADGLLDRYGARLERVRQRRFSI